MRGLGERLRQRMELLELDTKTLAERLGVTDRTINNYLKDEREPDLEGFVRLCLALATTPDKLLDFSNNRLTTAVGAAVEPSASKRAKRGSERSHLRQKRAM